MENLPTPSHRMSVDEASQGGAKSGKQSQGQQPASQAFTTSDKTTPSLASDATSHRTSPMGDTSNNMRNDGGPDIIVVDDDVEFLDETIVDEIQVVGEKRHDPPVPVNEDGPPPDKVRRSSELRSIGEVDMVSC